MGAYNGIGHWFGMQDPSFGACFLGSPLGWGKFDPVKVRACFEFSKASKLNLHRFLVPTDFCKDSNYIARIRDICTIAQLYGHTCEFIVAGTGRTLNGDIMGNLVAYQTALNNLASGLKDVPNSAIGVVNEPTTTNDINYYNSYMAVLPSILTSMRNQGFSGPIMAMGATAISPLSTSPGRSFKWAVDHPEFFNGTYGKVICEAHVYPDYEKKQGNFPTGLGALSDLYLNKGYLQAALDAKIPIIIGETGVRLAKMDGTRYYNYDPEIQKQDLANLISLMNSKGISVCGWVYSATDEFRMLSQWDPPVWNDVGSLYVGAIEPPVVAPPLPQTGSTDYSAIGVAALGLFVLLAAAVAGDRK